MHCHPRNRYVSHLDITTLTPWSTIALFFQQNNIDLVCIEFFINTVNKMDIWSCYIPLKSNISILMLSNIFDNLSFNCIFGGDLNCYHSCWGFYNIVHQGSLIFFSTNAVSYMGELNVTWKFERSSRPDCLTCTATALFQRPIVRAVALYPRHWTTYIKLALHFVRSSLDKF